MGVTTSTNVAFTYVPIATTTLGSSAASYTFSSIPSTYTDLVLVLQGQDTGADNLYFRLNSDSGTNYSFTTLNGNGTANTNRVTNSTFGRFAWYAAPNNAVPNWIGRVQFMNYSNTTTYKTILGRTDIAGVTYSGTEATVNTWRSTSAINSITLYWGGTDSWAAGSNFTLYGIASA